MILAATLCLLIATPAATAQFGTIQRMGDYGHVPVTTGASAAVRVLYADMGVSGDARDDCIYLDVSGTTTTLANKDIRLIPCAEKALGSAIGDADTSEKSASTSAPVFTVKFADVNRNGKYDTGDYVYFTSAAGGADLTLAPTTGPASWTVRMTPAGDLKAGTWVYSQDADFIGYGTASSDDRESATAGTQGWSVVERDDKIRFLLPHAVATAPFDVKGAMIIADAVRVNSVVPLQPAFKVNKLEMDSTTLPAGASFTGKAEVQNTGKVSGVGIIVAKVKGVIVDAQMTPLMSPGEKVTMTMKGFAPTTGTSAAFEVGDQVKIITVTGAEAFESNSNEELLARLSALESELATLKSAQTSAAAAPSAADASIKPLGAAGAAESPAPTFMWMVLILGVAFAIRRRNA